MVVDQQQQPAVRWFNEKGIIECSSSLSLAKWENFFIWFAPPLHVNPRKTSRKYKWHLNSVRSERGKQSNEECSKKFNYIHTQQLFQFFFRDSGCTTTVARREEEIYKYCHCSLLPLNKCECSELLSIRLCCISCKHYQHKQAQYSMRTQMLMFFSFCSLSSAVWVHASQKSL